VTSVSGKLDLETAQRNGYQQKVSGREDRLPDDQGGHLIASIFNGPGDRLNLVPMDGNFNMGAWKSMETRFADALKAGKQVDVKMEIVYSAESNRPAGFVVTSTIDGIKDIDTFRNVAGGR
jgi:DNA/RNA non-specific endonuclease